MKEIIKNALEKIGMTQKQLASAIHVSPQAVSQWIKGEKQPTWDNIKLMTEIFGIEFGNEILKKGLKKKINMKKQPSELEDLNTIEKAQSEAKNLLDSSGIHNYSKSVYTLLDWLLTAVIGLVYHRYINNKNEDDTYYEDIYFYLNDITEEGGKDIRDDFYYMGGDLFESFGEDKLPNDEYARQCMDLWYRFKKIYDFNDESDFNKEFKTALLDLIAKNSECY